MRFMLNDVIWFFSLHLRKRCNGGAKEYAMAPSGVAGFAILL